ncbi:MAG TPA: hypothetical protein VNI02_05655 [Blastocatellia bacterium]|nr:hypothetical protein [Blastocatellia bacterium]
MAEFDTDIQQLLISPKSFLDANNIEERHALDVNEIENWYTEEFEQIFAWKKSVFAAALFTLVALIIALKIEIAAWFPNSLTKLLGFLPYLFIGTAFGACVWPGYRMSVFVYNLARDISHLNPFLPGSVGIFNIARTFIKFEAVGIILLLLFGTAFELSPYKMNNKFILYSASIVSLVWTFWFYFTQSQIHNAMIRYKHQKQSWFADHYEKKLSLLLQNPDSDAFEDLNRLIILKKEIESIPVWPFNTRALITSLGLIATPLLAALAQRLLGK